jgi:hypothetical protein
VDVVRRRLVPRLERLRVGDLDADSSGDGGGGAFADSRTSPPLTGGKSQIEIHPAAFPEPCHFSVREYVDGLKDLGREGLARGAVALTPVERAQTLIDLLAAVDAAERQALNDVLAGLGAATRIVGGE